MDASKQSAVDFFRARLAFQTTPSELARDLETGRVVCLDVRDKGEFDVEHIPGAINVALADLEKTFERLPPTRPSSSTAATPPATSLRAPRWRWRSEVFASRS